MKLTKTTPEVESAASAKRQDKKPPSNRKKIRVRLIGLLIGFGVGAFLAVVVSGFIYDSQVNKSRYQQLEVMSKNQAELAAASLNDYFNKLIQQVQFAAAKTSVRDALVAQDDAGLKLAEASLRKQIDAFRYAHFLKPGQLSIDENHIPPIRYSELAMIRAAEMGQVPSPEAVKVGDEWLLYIVVPVTSVLEQFDGGKSTKTQLVDGVIWVSTQIKTLPALLQGERAQQGRFTLVQNFSRNRVVVNSHGTADLDIGQSAKLNDSHWEVEYFAHSSLLANTHISYGFVWLAILGASLLCIILVSIIGFLVGRQFELSLNRKKMAHRMHGAINNQAGDGYVDPMYQTQNILDVRISDVDQSILAMDDDQGEAKNRAVVAQEALSLDDDVFELSDAAINFPAEVFRAYDIRGIAETQLNKEFALTLGKAIGSQAQDLRASTVVVGRDARLSSPLLTEWLVRGILSTGCHVLNIGTVPTPLMYFALATMDEFNCGVMVTASHNKAAYNGFKIVMNGEACSEGDIQALRQSMIAGKFFQGQGQEHHHDIVSNYVDTIFSDVALAGEMVVVIDAGNGVAGKVAPLLFEELGCRVIPLYCDLDGNFPNHDPDPSKEENLADLIRSVKENNADVGIALDGDGDRLTVVSPSGDIIWADRLLILFARDILSRSPGEDVIFDVKSTRHLNAEIAQAGGRPIMWKTGHSLMKRKMQETGAVIGAEYSGHIFIKDRWFGFDDGMYAAARLLELLSLQGENVDEAFEDVPKSLATPEIRISVPEKNKFAIVEQLLEIGDFGEGRLTTIDGLRADFAHGWGLVRASNTGPELTLRFEADDEQSLHTLRALFVGELRKVDKNIEIKWKQ